MSRAQPIHAPMDRFPVVDDCLEIGGESVTALAERVGDVPFYVYDRRIIGEQVRRVREALPDGISLHYAMKANPMPALVRHVGTLVDGLDVASGGELEVALASGVPAREMSFAGPGKSEAEIAAALRAGVLINTESETELERITRIAAATSTRARVAIRVNPDFELKASGMKMAGGAKPFGIDAERVPQTLSGIDARHVDCEGFHIYTGSQNLRPEAIVEAHDATFELAFRLADSAREAPRVLNIGGGFGIPYFPGDAPLDLAPIGDNLAARLDEVRGRLGDVEVVVELGRYLVGEAGLYVCRIVDRKESRGEVFLITNGGLHHHLAASGNFGQVIRKNYPVVIANRVRGTARETASVVGPLCTPLDLLASRADLARADVGDLVAVYQSGAYGLTASPTAFLSHPPPAELFV